MYIALFLQEWMNRRYIMAKDTEVTQENGRENILFTGSLKLFRAGLGAVMLAQDELGSLANKLVEKGESTEEKSRQRFDDFIADRRKQAKKASRRIETRFDKRAESVLHRFNIPTRSEIKSLNTKITQLSKKVDELKKSSA
jgi:poly(hydroxyalkanoate) granule-associated protein